MGVGAPHGADAAIQIVAQRQLLAGGLRVEVQQRKGGLLRLVQFPQQLVGGGEGIGGLPVQVAPADQRHNGDAQRTAVVHAAAPPRHTAGEIGRPQDIAVVLQIVRDLHAAEGMVAQRDHVGPGGKQLVRLGGRQPGAGDILPVDHGKRNIFQLFQRRKVAAQMLQTVLAGHVTDGQNIIQHDVLLSRFFPWVLCHNPAESAMTAGKKQRFFPAVTVFMQICPHGRHSIHRS